MTAKLRVNIVSESDISVQGHGVHTAFTEMTEALQSRDDIDVIRGEFGKRIDCDIIHLHTIGMRTWRKFFQKGPKKVVSAHIIPDSFIGSIRLAKYWRFAARWYMGWFYGRADKVLAVSGMVAESLRSELGVAPEKIQVLYNSIDMSRYTPTGTSRSKARATLGVGDDEFMVVGNGQVQPRKRLDTFTAMAMAHPDVKFVWVGGIPFKQLGADYAAMNRLMSTAPDNLTFTGVIPHSEVKAYYHAADVFCLPAEQENHPMCVLEAAGAELPIIVRDISEYDDTFKDDVLRCGSDDEFIQAIATMRNPHTRALWTERSHAVRDRFDSRQMTDVLVDIYRNLV